MREPYITELNRQIAREIRICGTYGLHPMKSKQYMKLTRFRTIYFEGRNPAIRALKSALLILISIAIPLLLWMLAYTAHSYIVLLNQ